MTPDWLLRLARAAGIAFAMAATIAAGNAAAIAADSAVILQYHRFGEDAYPSTSVTLDQLEAHIEHLSSGGYTVLPVPEILAALDAGRPLPDRAIGITVDDATRSTFVEAWPRLEEAGFPFTVFVSTDPVDQGHAGIMSWDELRQLVAAGVTIGNHGAAHGRMWQNDGTANREDLEKARRRIQEELGMDATLFAYPYGEWNGALRALVTELGFAAAFGQHSGVVGAHSDTLNLPRFALNQNYGDIDRFKLIADTLPARRPRPDPDRSNSVGKSAGHRLHDRAAAGEPQQSLLLCVGRRWREPRPPGGGPRGGDLRPGVPAWPGPAQLHRPRRRRALALVRPAVRRALTPGLRRSDRRSPVRWVDHRRPLAVVQPRPVEVAEPVLADDPADRLDVGPASL